MDDCITFSTSDRLSKIVEALLQCKYGIKDVKPFDYLLGIEAIRDEKTGNLALSQRTYIEKLLRRHQMEDCKAASTPMAPNLNISKDEDGVLANEHNHRSIIGGLAYCMSGTRPDIAFAVSKLSRYLHRPTQMHMKAAKQVLRYLKGSKDKSLIISHGDQNKKLEMFVDSDFAGCLETRRSTSGCMIFYNGTLISWRSKRQSLPALSSAEAEYISLSEGMKEAIWLKNLFSELNDKITCIPTYEDNQACIHIAQTAILSQRSKSIDLKYHFARHYVQEEKLFDIHYISTSRQLADILTKPLPTSTFLKLISQVFIDRLL